VRTLRFLFTALTLALGALRRNALRGALTALGILIGVAAVTIVVALGEGASAAVSGRIDSMGQNALIVVPEDNGASGARDGAGGPMLTEGDAAAIEREVPSVAVAAPLLQGGGQVAWRDANVLAQFVGTDLGFFAARGWKVARGTLWPKSAETTGEKVCVIGTTIQRDLFGIEDPVGQVLRIGRQPFRVIGVLEQKGQSTFGQDQDAAVVIPLATYRAKITPTRPGQVSRILLSARSQTETERAQREVTALLRQRHRLEEGVENDFSIRSQEEFRRIQETILGVLSSLLLTIAAVSLLVGGIGVMNIMLVSVAERTREIGIRMAIGAREGDILVQFLVEAVLLSLLGGLLGAGLAALAVNAIAGALEWDMQVSRTALGVALAVSTLIGVGFGFVPARRAARLDPIQALRRE
jgi:putative ABC transport system permease protein